MSEYPTWDDLPFDAFPLLRKAYASRISVIGVDMNSDHILFTVEPTVDRISFAVRSPRSMSDVID